MRLGISFVYAEAVSIKCIVIPFAVGELYKRKHCQAQRARLSINMNSYANYINTVYGETLSDDFMIDYIQIQNLLCR